MLKKSIHNGAVRHKRGVPGGRLFKRANCFLFKRIEGLVTHQKNNLYCEYASITAIRSTESLSSRGSSTILERNRTSVKEDKQTPHPQTDNSGDGGNHGGKTFKRGGGGDDDDDDDDYFDFSDGGGDGADREGWLCHLFPENYNKIALQAILGEWFRTVSNLPLWLRGMVEMGLFSSQQLARFLTIDMRPNFVRHISRSLPVGLRKELVGRLMADPAFIHKMLIDQAICFVTSLTLEVSQRGTKFMEELDLVVINLMTISIVHGLLIWMLAPSRSFGIAHHTPLGKILTSLPNNVFDKSTKCRLYTLRQRVTSAVVRATEFAIVGAFMGSALSVLGNATVEFRRTTWDPNFHPTVPIPSFYGSAAGSSAIMGADATIRYQCINGIDRYAFERVPLLPVYLSMSTLTRMASHVVGKYHLLDAMGLPKGVRPMQVASAIATDPKRRKERRTCECEN